MSLLGARISSIIMLSLVKELRFSVLDLSELKERRLLAFTVYHTQCTGEGAGHDNEMNTKHRHTQTHAQKNKYNTHLLLHAASRETGAKVQKKNDSTRVSNNGESVDVQNKDECEQLMSSM